jgi:hypothetical protein
MFLIFFILACHLQFLNNLDDLKRNQQHLVSKLRCFLVVCSLSVIFRNRNHPTRLNLCGIFAGLKTLAHIDSLA